VQNSLAQKTFLENQGLRDNSDQYNKIIEDTDTERIILIQIIPPNKFVPLNFEATHKWYITNSNSLF
jgi:hypothetical protein